MSVYTSRTIQIFPAKTRIPCASRRAFCSLRPAEPLPWCWHVSPMAEWKYQVGRTLDEVKRKG